MFRRIKAIVTKEFRQIRRDFLSLFVLVCVPAFMLAMFGYALNFDVSHISMAVCDKDKTRQSRDFIAGFAHSEYFTMLYEPEDDQGIDRLLDQGKIRLGLVVPKGFGNTLRAGKAETVQVLVDGSNSNTATTIVGYVQRLVQDYSSQLVMRQAAGSPAALSSVLDIRPRIWYNPQLESARFLVPGLMGFVVMLSAVISTAMSVVREKERGTMEQLVVSPVRAGEIIIGKTIPYVLISLLASLIILIAGYLLFGIQVKGSYIDLFIVMLVFIVANLFFGIFISTIAHSQQVAFLISVISTMIPHVCAVRVCFSHSQYAGSHPGRDLPHPYPVFYESHSHAGLKRGRPGGLLAGAGRAGAVFPGDHPGR